MKLSLIFGIFGFLMFIFLGVLHEQVHVQVYKSYGIESKVEYFKDFPDFTIYAEKPCPTSECILANNINEVVGYHLTAFYMMLFIGVFIIILMMEEKGEEKIAITP